MTNKSKKYIKPNFEDIVESLSDMIYELDGKERFYYANSMLERLSGYSKKELKQLHFTDLVKKSQVDKLQEFYIQQRKEQVTDTYYEFVMVSKSGKEIWVGQNVKMLFKADGKVKFVRAVARDITHLRKLRLQSEQRAKKLEKAYQEQQKIQKNLEEKNALTNLILNTMAEAVVVIDSKGEFVLFNEAAKQIVGKGAADLDPKEWSKYYGSYYLDKETLIPIEDLPLMHALNGREVHNFESYIKNNERKDGIYVKYNSRPLRDKDDNIVGALLVTTNINDQKEYENRLRASEEKFRAMSDASPLGIFVTDQEGACEYTNAEYEKISGLTFHEALGEGWAKAIHEEDRERVFKGWFDAVKNKEMFSTEMRYKQKNGRVVWSKVKASAMTVQDDIIGYVGTVEDITDSKKNHEALLQAKEQAEKASKAKEDFLSTMSHEIRTPLNAVIGMAHLLQDESPQEHQIENLNALRFSADNLLVLINDILDYNKIESGKVTFEKVDVDLKKLITRIRQSLSLKAEEKNIRFNAIFDTDIPDVVLTDPVRLNQIMTNLVSNAIKFTEKGFVKIEVLLESDDDKSAIISFAVKDSGIGIEKDQQAYVFDRFTQAEKATTRKYGGTGLGLAITRKLVELQGGKMQLTSEPGKGSEFSFTLQFEKGKSGALLDSSTEQEVFPTSLAGTKVLIVEDNQINQVVATKFLKKWNMSVDIANDGKEALEKLTKSAFDLVLMDLQMPVMDGFEATQEIKKDSKLKDLPIIALTASALSEERENVFRAGMDDFLTKPLNPQELYTKIARVVDKEHIRINVPEIKAKENQQLFNTETVETLAEGDDEFLKSMFESYLVELDRLLVTYKDIVKKEDIELYRAMKHKLSASIDLFSANLLKDEILKTEALLVNNQPAKLKNNLKNIERLVETIVEIVKKKISNIN